MMTTAGRGVIGGIKFATLLFQLSTVISYMATQLPTQQQQEEASAFALLNLGKHAEARQHFERLLASGTATITAELGLAFVCRAQGDYNSCLTIARRLLGQDPNNLWALMLGGDCYFALDDTRAASAFYQAMLKAAAKLSRISPDLQRELQRVQKLAHGIGQQFEQHLSDRLKVLADDGMAKTSRFNQSVDLLFGKREVYVQEPKFYYFPELPQIQFYDNLLFPWLAELEKNTDAIRTEMLAVLHAGSAFEPYVKRSENRPPIDHDPMCDNSDWSAFYLWKDGLVVEANAARCPRTMAALTAIPLTDIAGRCPNVLFSQLRPGAHIPPHNGFFNTRLIGHLPLVVPPGCGFRVGSETRPWQEGRAWLFDDSIQHEAWNKSDQTRVILLFEIWRPELTMREREQVRGLFDAIDRFGGGLPEWGI